MSQRVFLELSFRLSLYCLWSSTTERIQNNVRGPLVWLLAPDSGRRLPGMGFQWFSPGWLKLWESSFLLWVQICLPRRYTRGPELWWWRLRAATHISEDGCFSTKFSFSSEHPVSFLRSCSMIGCPLFFPLLLKTSNNIPLPLNSPRTSPSPTSSALRAGQVVQA